MQTKEVNHVTSVRTMTTAGPLPCVKCRQKERASNPRQDLGHCCLSSAICTQATLNFPGITLQVAHNVFSTRSETAVEKLLHRNHHCACLCLIIVQVCATLLFRFVPPYCSGLCHISIQVCATLLFRFVPHYCSGLCHIIAQVCATFTLVWIAQWLERRARD